MFEPARVEVVDGAPNAEGDVWVMVTRDERWIHQEEKGYASEEACVAGGNEGAMVTRRIRRHAGAQGA